MEKNKQRIYAVIALVALALLVVGATYAYFQNQYSDSSQTDVKVTTYTTDLLTFETGDAINITADQDTFAQGKGNQTGSSFAKAILQANSKTNVATANYYIYLNIESNEFTYTSEDNKAELVIQVTDNSGNPVTSIDGLTYVTVVDGSGTSISGFDITEKSGVINLVNNKEISASPKTEEQYNISLVLVNYDFDQNNNTGKSFNAKLMIQKEKINLLSDYVISQYTGTQGENGLYYHDSSLENGANDNSYRYLGLDYILTDEGKALDVERIILDNNNLDNGLIESYCGDNKIQYRISCDTDAHFQIKNSTDKYYKFSDVIDKLVELKYIEKDQIKNYVCFGSDEEICASDNLYRIIGVFDGRVKLIKADYANSDLLGTDGDYSQEIEPLTKGSTFALIYKGKQTSLDEYYYNYNMENKYIGEWKSSLLNKVNLNTNFLNNIGEKWSNIISEEKWKVCGYEPYNLSNTKPSELYQNEILNCTDIYKAKVGLIYPNEYLYSDLEWGFNSIQQNASDYRILNWMNLGISEYTISPRKTYRGAYYVSEGLNGDNFKQFSKMIRPTFYLKSSVEYSSGTGTSTDPIRISVN